jgi:hypothetical protein
VQGGTLANGTPVQLWDCNGHAQQSFAISTGSTKIQVQGTNFCVDVGSGPTSGTQLKIWTVSTCLLERCCVGRLNVMAVL